ncbi:hypothetical protein ACFQZC_20675 [Streptacidiphilus monticola]
MVSHTVKTDSLNDEYIGGQWVGQAFGGTVAGPIWRDAMSGALSGVPFGTLSTVALPKDPTSDPNKGKNKGQTQGQTQGQNQGQTAGAFGGLTGLIGIAGGNNGNGNGNGGHR